MSDAFRGGFLFYYWLHIAGPQFCLKMLKEEEEVGTQIHRSSYEKFIDLRMKRYYIVFSSPPIVSLLSHWSTSFPIGKYNIISFCSPNPCSVIKKYNIISSEQ